MTAVKMRGECSIQGGGAVYSKMQCAWAGPILLFVSGLASAQLPVTTPKVVCGRAFSFAISESGNVWAWGNNSHGQLGLGHTTNQATPQLIPGLSNVTNIAAGDEFAVALLADGTLRTWGRNFAGQLGIGHTVDMWTPQVVSFGPAMSVKSVAVGSHHVIVGYGSPGNNNPTLSVSSWGSNSHGQLGLGHQTNALTPNMSIGFSFGPPGGGAIKALAGAGSSSYVLYNNGTIMACGQNSYGQLGIGNSQDHDEPQITALGIPAVAISAGQSYCFALLSTGQVASWGANISGQLALGNLVSHTLPQLAQLGGAAAISAGYSFAFARFANGTVQGWGANEVFQLGIGNTVFYNSPQPIPGLSNVSSLSAGAWHGLALHGGGTSVSAWGSNAQGQLGLGNLTNQSTPQTIPGLCLTTAGTYALELLAWNATTVGINLPCNVEVGALGMGHYYFNAFSVDPLNATSPGTGGWYGLHTTQAEVLSWLDAGAAGLSVAFGALNSSGGAYASVAVPPAQLAGLTVYGVSVALNPFTGVVADSNVASHTY